MSQRCKIAFLATAFAATCVLPAAAEVSTASAPKSAKVATVKKPAKPHPASLVAVNLPPASACHLGCPGFIVTGIGF